MARPPTTPVRQRKNRVLNLPLGEGAARRRRKRGGTRSDLAPPHTRPGFAGPPSPRRGSSTFPWGKVPPAGSPRRRKPSPPGKVAGPKALTDEGSQPTKRTGPGLNFQGSPPHPSGLRPATLSKQERAFCGGFYSPRWMRSARSVRYIQRSVFSSSVSSSSCCSCMSCWSFS